MIKAIVEFIDLTIDYRFPTMNKTLFTFLLIGISLQGLLAQIVSPIQPKLSPLTQQYLLKKKNNLSDGKPLSGYVYKIGVDGKTYISAMIKVDKKMTDNSLTNLGIRIGTKAGNIWTVQVPPENIKQFIQISGISYIQLDEPIAPYLDSLRKVTHVDSVHAGYNLPMEYTGEGIVTGIIDVGFDYGHPQFFDITGKNYRVVKVWEQKTVSGTPPSGFIYGDEITDTTELWSRGSDNKHETHGTHVAGIFAGSGVGSTNSNNTRYRGVAYNSEIVLVGITPDKQQWIGTGVSDIVDGAKYIYDYAESVGKPAVINLSWGSPLGPRDGSSLFSEAIDNLTGLGKIFVCAAGNSGTSNIHIKKSFTSSDSLVSSFVMINNTDEGKNTWLDAWGDTGKIFCINLSLYRDSTHAVDSTGFICIDNNTHEFYLIGSDGDTCTVTVTTSASEFNQRPRIFVNLSSHSKDNICISLKAKEGDVNMWSAYIQDTHGIICPFVSLDNPWAVDGANDMTVSDLATTKSIIAVGAFVSKVRWMSADGTIYSYPNPYARGDIALFTSKGPSLDGRVRPDICAPGFTITSGASSYDSTLYSGGSSYMYVTNKYHFAHDGRYYPFATLTGTSMASPGVAGIAALMLQAYKFLDPYQISAILKETAMQDMFTGVIPPEGDNTWGSGKVNAYAAVKKALLQYAGVNTPAAGYQGCYIFPNPSDGIFSISYFNEQQEKIDVTVYDLTGRKLIQKYWEISGGENILQMNMQSFNKGVYFVKISSKRNISTLKAIVN